MTFFKNKNANIIPTVGNLPKKGSFLMENHRFQPNIRSVL